MTLGLNFARCAGRFGLGPDDPICPRRESCARYVALINREGVDTDGSWRGVSVCSGLCRDGAEFLIPVAA